MRYRILWYMKLLLILVLFIQPCSSVAAANDEFVCNVTVSSQTGEVTMQGSVPKIYTGQRISLEVINPDKSISNLKDNDPASMMDIVAYLEDSTVGANGAFSFKFKASKSGLYTAVIGVSGRKIAYTTTFNFYSSQYEQTIIDGINSKRSSANYTAFKQAFIDNYEVLNLNCILYNSLTAQGNNLDGFYKLMASSPSVSTASELQAQADEMILVYIVNSASNAQEVQSALESHKAALGINSSTAFDTYTNGGVAQYVCSEFAGKDFSSLSSINIDFKNQTIRYAILKANGWEPVKNVLTVNEALIGIDISKAEKLKSPSAAYRLLEGRDFATLADVQAAYDKAVKDRKEEEGGSGSGGSGGGGGRRNNADGSYSIQVIQPQNKTQNETESSFVDLDNVKWAKDSIDALCKKGIIKGKSSNMFMPDDSITREEFVKLLVLATDSYDSGAKVSFSDVQNGQWYYSYIASAVNSGIIKGKDSDAFGVGEVITREDMAVIAYRAVINKRQELSKVSLKPDFKDASDISEYAADGVAFMQNNNIILGNGDGQFLPKEYSTRAQAAVIVYRLIEFLSK